MLYDITKNQPPEKLYLDTNFLITSLIQTPTQVNRHTKARSFLDRIIHKKPIVFTSLLTQTEFIESCVYLALSPIVGKDVKGAVKARPELFKTHKKRIDKYIDRYKWAREKLPNKWNELAVDKQVISMAREYAQRYNLMFKDGIHLASSRLLFCDNIVTLDKDFARVNGINQYTLVKKT